MILIPASNVGLVGTPFSTAVGGVLSTIKVWLGLAADDELPARSDALPAAMEMASVPSPLMPEIATLRNAVPVPLTETVPSALPVFIRVTSPSASETESAPEYATSNVTGPSRVNPADGAPIETLGGVLSTVMVALGPAVAAKLPARSDALPAVTEMPSVPSPLMLESATVRNAVLVPLTDTVPSAVPVLSRVTSPAESEIAFAPE